MTNVAVIENKISSARKYLTILQRYQDRSEKENEENIIDSVLKTKMSGMVGFRNIIAHDYEEINYGIVVDVLNNGLADIEEFLGRIADINS